MLDIQQKRKLRSIMYHRVTLVVLGVLVLVAIRSTWIIYSKQRESDEQRRVAEEKVAELSVREAELDSKIDALKTDYGVEEEIRAKFNVAKENENVAIIVDDGTSLKPTTTSKTSFWQKVWNIFSF